MKYANEITNLLKKVNTQKDERQAVESQHDQVVESMDIEIASLKQELSMQNSQILHYQKSPPERKKDGGELLVDEYKG